MKKKLIEMALPLETINKEAAREKSIRHGHPSTLHLWPRRAPKHWLLLCVTINGMMDQWRPQCNASSI